MNVLQTGKPSFPRIPDPDRVNNTSGETIYTMFGQKIANHPEEVIRTPEDNIDEQAASFWTSNTDDEWKSYTNLDKASWDQLQPEEPLSAEAEVLHLREVIHQLEKKLEVQQALLQRKDDTVAILMRKNQMIQAKNKTNIALIQEQLNEALKEVEVARKKSNEKSSVLRVMALEEQLESATVENDTLKKKYKEASQQVLWFQARVRELETTSANRETEFRKKFKEYKLKAFGGGGGAEAAAELLMALHEQATSLQRQCATLRDRAVLEIEMVKVGLSEIIITNLDKPSVPLLDELLEVCWDFASNVIDSLPPEKTHGIPKLPHVSDIHSQSVKVFDCLSSILQFLQATQRLFKVLCEEVEENNSTFVSLATALKDITGDTETVILTSNAVARCRASCEFLSGIEIPGVARPKEADLSRDLKKAQQDVARLEALVSNMGIRLSGVRPGQRRAVDAKALIRRVGLNLRVKSLHCTIGRLLYNKLAEKAEKEVMAPPKVWQGVFTQRRQTMPHVHKATQWEDYASGVDTIGIPPPAGGVSDEEERPHGGYDENTFGTEEELERCWQQQRQTRTSARRMEGQPPMGTHPQALEEQRPESGVWRVCSGVGAWSSWKRRNPIEPPPKAKPNPCRARNRKPMLSINALAIKSPKAPPKRSKMILRGNDGAYTSLFREEPAQSVIEQFMRKIQTSKGDIM